MSKPVTRPMLAYLLRLWAEENGGQWVWRASLLPVVRQQEQVPVTGFASLETAVAHLQAEMTRAESESNHS